MGFLPYLMDIATPMEVLFYELKNLSLPALLIIAVIIAAAVVLIRKAVKKNKK
ncbi:MAG: hypothetical protein IJ306_00550 [Oscillospiraceae bacterium]|nr:hypothetical protein [Oscillospiraceae bacterium]